MIPAVKTQEKDEFLARCSPGYRAAVRGQRELPATKGKCGAVQFAAHGVSTPTVDGRSILRATIDEGQVVEIRMPAGLAVILCDSTPLGKAATIATSAKSETGGAR